ncbi:TetR-like C-terminal domain-containing protein, partial [Streptomyces sp. NPDC056728]
AHPAPSTPDELAAVAVAYVQFALEHPALFRVMFAEPCDPTSEERVAATAAISEYVRSIVRATFPDVNADALATTVWALVHGLAFLHLDGKLDISTPEVVATQVHAAVHALFDASPAMSRTAAPSGRVSD